jgi:hypothetical protein
MANEDGKPPNLPTPESLAMASELLETTRKSKQFVLEEAAARAEILKSQTNLNDYLKSQRENYEIIDKQQQSILDSQMNLVDQEQILDELSKVKLERLKKQFQINQQTLIDGITQLENERKSGKLSEEELARRKERLAILKKETEEQAKQIADLEKEKKLKEGFLSIGKELLNNLKQQGLALEQHIMNISKLNGGYAEYGSKLREANLQIYQATAGSGIMFEEANAAFAGLSQNFIGLTTQSDASIKTMSVGTALLTKLGVDAGSAAKGFDSLVNSMGKTPQQAYKIQESFVQMAAKNRLALGAVSQAFAENSSRFVGYGEQMTKVLDGLAEQSLKTGIAINKLVGIAQQFDTFEGAAKAVGNLNALLGGDYFNSIELLTASDEERIKLLKDGVAASGMQWESMNRFQKMAIANAAGISDLNEASKLFGKTSLENTKQQAEAAAVQKTLAEQAESVSTSMDKMKSVMNGVIIALDPIVSVLGTIVEGLTWFARAGGKLGEEVGGWGGKVITVLGSLISLGVILAAKNLILTRSFGAFGSVIAGATKKLWAWIAGKKAANEIANPVATPSPTAPAAGPAGPAGPGKFMSFVNNIKPGNLIAAAGALLILAAALFVTAKALQEFSTGVSWDGVGKAGIALASLVISALVLSKFAGQIGIGALIVLALSASLLVLGFALQMFSKVDWKLVAGIGAIILGLGLAIAGFGFAVSGPQALFIAAGIAMIIGIAGALLILGNSLEKISTSFKTLSELKNIGELSSNLISFLDDLADTSISPIKNLADAIGTLAENLQKLASVSSNMSLNVTGNAKTVLTEQVNAAAAAATKTSEAVSSAAVSKTEPLIPAQQTTAYVPLIVQIDKKTIIEILKTDIENIAGGKTTDILDAVGIVQSAFYVQNRVSAGTGQD